MLILSSRTVRETVSTSVPLADVAKLSAGYGVLAVNQPPQIFRTPDVQTDSQHSNENTVLLQIAAPVRSNRKTARTTVVSTIVALCTGRYLTAERLASLLNRELLSLQNHYLRALVKDGVLALRFPEPTHPHQAYTAAKPR